MNFKAAVANSLWLTSSLPAWVRFRRALDHPAGIQKRILGRYLARNRNTVFGKAYGFDRIKTYEEYARRVPLNDYEDLAPWIERIRRGENDVLTHDAVSHLVPTSGSSGPRKLIPFTRGLQCEFNRAIGAWIIDLYRANPSVVSGPAYWSISPAIRIVDSELSTVPIGFDDDAAYLGGIRKRLVNLGMAVPSELRLVSDMETFRYLTVLCLLRQSDLRLISVWHPSFLSLLLDTLPGCWKDLLQDIETGDCRYTNSLSPAVIRSLKLRPMPRRAKQLENASPAQPQVLWPHLKIISCWNGGNATFARADLERRFPSAFIQPKGLLATECVVTVPFSNSFPLAIHSHFFEFLDERGGVSLAHELERNGTYEVVVTTGGGLWRYRLRDQVQVTGFVGQTPALRFLGRAGNVSDRFGEKLSERFVGQSIHEVVGTFSVHFAMLAPEEGPSGCHYTLFIEGAVPDEVAAHLDTVLHQNPNYAWCRKSGQLGPLKLFRIKTAGYDAFVAREQSQGRSLGEIKPCPLSKETGWSQHLQQYNPTHSTSLTISGRQRVG